MTIKKPIKPKKATATQLGDHEPRESQIQAAILHYLRGRGHHVWPNKTTGTFDPRKGRFRAGTTAVGVPDIIGFHADKPGVVFFIEVKTRVGKLSPHQANFQRIAGQFQVMAFTARGVDDCIDKGL